MPEIRVPIVGSIHHQGALDKLALIPVDDPIALQRESSNPYDRNAIRCLYDGVMLGFIPKSHNTEIAKAIDSGLYEVKARFVTEPLVGGTTDKPLVRENARIIVEWE